MDVPSCPRRRDRFSRCASEGTRAAQQKETGMLTTTTPTPRGAWGYGKRAAKWLLTGAVVLWGSVAPAWAANQPTVQQMLQFKPRQDVAVSTPEPDKLDGCK